MEARRQYECDRKRRYRAEQRSNKKHLTAEADLLQELEWLGRQLIQRKGNREWLRRCAQDCCASVANNRTLRDQVRRYNHLTQTLHNWVHTSMTLSGASPWLHSTLIADPVARQYGYRWLTDRVFHSALAAHATTGSIDDMARVTVHANADCEIAGMKTWCQHTILVPYTRVASCLWDTFTQDDRSPMRHAKTLVSESDLFYKRVYDKLHGTNSCLLMRRYNLPTRIVFVRVFLRDDDCFPLLPHELRPHGFGWTAIEKITDDVTLYRSTVTHHAPVTTQGAISLDQTAAVFGVEPHPTSPATTLARIETNCLRNFLTMREHTTRELQRRLQRATTASDEAASMLM
ncbi:Aste57867_12575 [Aphanomyces stellatus]|uniref:Aste57867_12575 protein n=1 Tax=Aphanomyces stellatus TaxID=120398 RepID=A0A485KXY1_9STRA|nr:hypothetical protein As57867_012529 [Aphanomyces stellatus]VFT89426.1 Aste57867_12575 [Aphanomyces stellatus]